MAVMLAVTLVGCKSCKRHRPSEVAPGRSNEHRESHEDILVAKFRTAVSAPARWVEGRPLHNPKRVYRVVRARARQRLESLCPEMSGQSHARPSVRIPVHVRPVQVGEETR